MTDSGQLTMPLTEEYRIGQRILRNMKEEELRAAYLDALDTEMVSLYRAIKRSDLGVAPYTREPAYVCGDDARKKFEGWNPPPPETLSRNFLAALWKRKHWRFIDRKHRSQTENSHGNAIGRYALDERLYRERGES